MSKFGKQEQARREGAKWCIDLVIEKGIDDAIKELNWRGVTSCPMTMLDRAEIIRFQNEVKEKCMRMMCEASCLTLLDEFDFKDEQLYRYIERFNKKIECIEEDYATWNDYLEILKDEVGIDIFSDDLKKRIEAEK